MLTIYTLEQAEEWKNIVSSFKKCDTYYLPGYVRAFRIHGDGEPILVYWTENKKGTGTRGINVVMKRDISQDPHFKGKLEEGKYFDFSTPYGYGGWLIETDGSLELNTDQLFTDYERCCAENNIISEFVRFHPMLENQKECEDEYEVIGLGETVAIDLTSPDIIWNNFISKNRNMIRKASKNGVSIYNGRFPEVYQKFKAVYDSTMDKDNADPYYYFEDKFYESVLKDLPENAQVFWAELPNGKVIAASIMLGCNGYMNYHLSGSVREYSSLAATNLILYRTALWGSANGYRTLYLGGGVGSGEDSLFKFKKAFNREESGLHRFYIGEKVFNAEIYKELCNISGHETDYLYDGFFPVYRAK